MEHINCTIIFTKNQTPPPYQYSKLPLRSLRNDQKDLTTANFNPCVLVRDPSSRFGPAAAEATSEPHR